MQGFSTRPASFVLCAFAAALMLGGCANDPRWNVPPHETSRFVPFSTGQTECNQAMHSDKNPGCYSEEKQKAIKRYQAAQKAALSRSVWGPII